MDQLREQKLALTIGAKSKRFLIKPDRQDLSDKTSTHLNNLICILEFFAEK